MATSWLNLEGKTVVVTGGASGIGKAVAQEFLQNGANVVVCDINPNAPEFDEANGKFEYVVTDVTSRESVEAMVEKAKAAFGQIDVLVNNAGINIPRLLVDPKDPKGKYELDDKVWDKVSAINFKGVYLCAQAVARDMVARKEGVIINMSSECGLEGSEGQSIYAATKAAVNALTRSWAKELGRRCSRHFGSNWPAYPRIRDCAELYPRHHCGRAEGRIQQDLYHAAGPLWQADGGSGHGELPGQRPCQLCLRRHHQRSGRKDQRLIL